MEPDQDGSVAESERLRAETDKLEDERTKLLAEARWLDNNTLLDIAKVIVAAYAAIVADLKAAESLGWL